MHISQAALAGILCCMLTCRLAVITVVGPPVAQRQTLAFAQPIRVFVDVLHFQWRKSGVSHSPNAGMIQWGNVATHLVFSTCNANAWFFVCFFFAGNA